MSLDDKLTALPQAEPADRSGQPAAPLTQISIKRRKSSGAATLALPRKPRNPEQGATPALGTSAVVEVARVAEPAPRRTRKSGLVFGPVPNGSAAQDDSPATSAPVAAPAAVGEPAPEPAPTAVVPAAPEATPDPEPAAMAQVEPTVEAGATVDLAMEAEPDLPFAEPESDAEPTPVEVQAAPPVAADTAPPPEVAELTDLVHAPAAQPEIAAEATPQAEEPAPAPTIPESTPAHVPLPATFSRSEAIARAVRMAALSSARGNAAAAPAAPRVSPPPAPRPAETTRPSDLFGYWTRVKNGRRFPARGDFDANEIAENWPNSMLLTCESQGSGVTFSKILRFGDHRTRAGEEFSFTSMITEWILSVGGEVARVGRPVQDNEVFVTPDGNHAYRIVALPLGDEQSRVDHVLCHLTRS